MECYNSHMFKPAAIALAAAGVFLMASSTTTATRGINYILAFELPPSFFELMFVFSILLQYRSAVYYLQDRLPPITSAEVWKSIPLVKEKPLFCERHRRAYEPWGHGSGDPQLLAFAAELRLRYAVVQDIDRLRNYGAHDRP